MFHLMMLPNAITRQAKKPNPMLQQEFTGRLIQILMVMTEPIVQMDNPKAHEYAEQWLKDNGITVDDVAHELEKRQ